MISNQGNLVKKPENNHDGDLSDDEENNLSSTLIRPNARANKEDQERRDVLMRLQHASIICGIFFCIEITGGIFSSSLSILSDAAHLFADLASFIIAILASHLANRPPCEQYTFGYKRVEALAALFSVGSLALVSIFLFGEAILRLWVLCTEIDVEPVNGKVMSAIAFFGVIVNIILAFILGEDHVHLPGISHDHEHNHNHDHLHEDHDDDDNQYKPDNSLELAHIHTNGEYCVECEPNTHDTTAEVVDNIDIPDWKRKALEQNLDPLEAPFGGSWNTNIVWSVHDSDSDSQSRKTEQNDGKYNYIFHHDHKHEHKHDHNELHQKHLSDQGDNDHDLDKTQAFESSLDHDYHHELCIEAKPVKNINLSAAYLHVLGDLAMSVAVLLSGIAIWVNPKLQAIDPLCTVFFCIYVFKSTLPAIKSSLSILMEEVPTHLNYESIFAAMSSVEGVCDVHDLHIWSISHGVPALSAHVLVYNEDESKDTRRVLKNIHQICVSKFGIFHNTIQIQILDDEYSRDCITCKDGMMIH